MLVLKLTPENAIVLRTQDGPVRIVLSDNPKYRQRTAAYVCMDAPASVIVERVGREADAAPLV